MFVDRVRNVMVYKVNVYCYIYDIGSVYIYQEVFFGNICREFYIMNIMNSFMI